MGKLMTARGQSTAEYAILIAIVLAAVVGMQTYVKRTLQARYKMATDTMTKMDPTKAASAVTFPGWVNLDQYEPYYAASTTNTERGDAFTEKYEKGKVTRSGVFSKSTRTGDQSELGADKIADDNDWK